MNFLLAALLAATAQAQDFGAIPPGLRFESGQAASAGVPGRPVQAAARRPRKPRRSPAPSRPADPASPAPELLFHGARLPRVIFTARGGSPAAEIAKALGATRQTARVALYALTLPDVTQALLAARSRGVDVQVIFDYGHAYPRAAGSDGAMGVSPQLQQVLDAGIPVRLLRGSGPYGIMHSKFAILDGALVETGSFNWTTAAESYNHENAVFRDESGLVSDYQADWDWMWAQAVPYGQGRAGTPSGTPPSCASQLSANGATFAACSFSPNGRTEDEVVSAIDSASGRVHVAMYSFTSDAIAQALIRAKRRGADVLVALDRGQLSHSTAAATLRDAGVPVKILTGPNGKGMLHDKFGVFDGLVELGSFNWTTNANLNNYENALFSSDQSDVEAYEAEFQKLWSEGADS